MHILQSILKYVTRSWYPVPMCDVRVSTYPSIHVFHCVIRVSAYPLLNIVKSLPGEGWYFRLRIRVSSLFRGAASKWQGILQLSPLFFSDLAIWTEFLSQILTEVSLRHTFTIILRSIRNKGIQLTVAFSRLAMRRSTSQRRPLPLIFRVFILGSISIEDTLFKDA